MRQDSLVATTLPYVTLLTLVSLVFFFVKSYFVMFLLFEVLLLLSLGLLRLTSKSERVGEAISEMFLWTLFGSFFLLLGFFLFYLENGELLSFGSAGMPTFKTPSSALIALFLVVGFGVKVPSWPFIS